MVYNFLASGNPCFPGTIYGTSTPGEILKAIRMRWSWWRFSFVVSLLFWCGPFAVLQTIWARIVFSFQGSPLRPWSHVGKKNLEGIYPFFTNGNTTSAISCVTRIGRIGASLFHPGPSIIFGSVAHIVGDMVPVPMPCAKQAGRKPSIKQAVMSCFALLATIAYTYPCRTKGMGTHSPHGKYFKLPEFPSDNVFNWHIFHSKQHSIKMQEIF